MDKKNHLSNLKICEFKDSREKNENVTCLSVDKIVEFLDKEINI